MGREAGSLTAALGFSIIVGTPIAFDLVFDWPPTIAEIEYFYWTEVFGLALLAGGIGTMLTSRRN